MTNIINRLLSLPIYFYRYAISPLLGPRCRFTPTCSEYALEALRQNQPHYAVLLILRRISKCHPFHPGGYDPAPKQCCTRSCIDPSQQVE